VGVEHRPDKANPSHFSSSACVGNATGVIVGVVVVVVADESKQRPNHPRCEQVSDKGFVVLGVVTILVIIVVIVGVVVRVVVVLVMDVLVGSRQFPNHP
jgi:ABC-type branched-subunit amino acid transport system permease subunit